MTFGFGFLSTDGTLEVADGAPPGDLRTEDLPLSAPGVAVVRAGHIWTVHGVEEDGMWVSWAELFGTASSRRPLHLRVFGEFGLFSSAGDRVVVGRETLYVLAQLVAERGAPVARRAVWRGVLSDLGSPRAALKRAIRALEDVWPGVLLIDAERETVRVDDTVISDDVSMFWRAFEEAERRYGAGDPAGARAIFAEEVRRWPRDRRLLGPHLPRVCGPFLEMDGMVPLGIATQVAYVGALRAQSPGIEDLARLAEVWFPDGRLARVEAVRVLRTGADGLDARSRVAVTAVPDVWP